MTSSASTTCYNRADDHCNINDLVTPHKIIDVFLLCSSLQRDHLENPSHSHPLKEAEAVPQSLWEYNVSQEQWSTFRNEIFFQQKLQRLVNFVCLPIGVVTFCVFYLLLSLVSGVSRREAANFPGGEVVFNGLLISLATASFVSLFATILYQCWHTETLNRICQNTQLGMTYDGVSVRICSDREHSWIEIYIPSTSSLPQPV